MMKRTKVAVITPGILPVPAVRGGAVEVLTTYLLEGFEEAGKFDVDIFTCSDPDLDKINYKHVHIIPINPDTFHLFLGKWSRRCYKYLKVGRGFNPYQYELKKQFHSNLYQIVLFENCMGNICALRKKKKCGKWLFHLHNDIEEPFNDKDVSNFRVVMQTCDLILACSNFIKRRCLEYSTSKSYIETFYNAIDLEVFDVKNNKLQQSLRRELGLKEKDYVFLYSGRLVEEKGIEKLLNAFIKSEDRIHRKLIIAGQLNSNFPNEQKYINKIINIIKSKDENDHIILTDYIEYSKISYLYIAADCIVFPSQAEEAFGMTVVEAMAMAKPVIATKTGGVIELVDSNTGILVDKGENCVEQLKNAMIWMEENREDSKRLGMNGYKKLMECKNWHRENYFNNFLSIIKERLEGLEDI